MSELWWQRLGADQVKFGSDRARALNQPRRRNGVSFNSVLLRNIRGDCASVIVSLVVSLSCAVAAQAGNTEPGLRELNDDVSRNPKWAMAYIRRATFYHNSLNDDEAIADYTKAIQLAENPQFAYAQRGACYMDMGKLSLAEQDFRKSLEGKDPTFRGRAARSLGTIKKSLKQYPQAIEFFKQATDAGCMPEASLSDAAECYLIMKDPSSALTASGKAVALFEKAHTRDARAFALHGQALMELKKFEPAINDFTKALNVNTNGAKWYQNVSISPYRVGYLKMRAECFEKVGKKALAQNDLRAASELEKANFSDTPFRMK